jgi:hypothetical protein
LRALAVIVCAAACTFPEPAIRNPECPDKDKDGWPDSTCQGPAGDCNDDDAEVFPGQTKFFPIPIKGTTSFDYDCSGVIERESFPTIPDCPGLGISCPENPGYKSNDCGKNEAVKCKLSLGQCQPVDTNLPALKCH